MINNTFMDMEKLYDKIRKYFGIDTDNSQIKKVNMADIIEQYYDGEEKIINCNESEYFPCYFDINGLYIMDEELAFIPFFGVDKTEIFNKLREQGYDNVIVNLNLPIIKEIFSLEKSKKRVRI